MNMKFLFHARAVLEEMGLENEVTLIGARVHGSRSRDDLYRADSDLDVVLFLSRKYSRG